jgi:hypothetical protein
MTTMAHSPRGLRTAAHAKADENLSEFIRSCRGRLKTLGATISWDEDHWPSARMTFGNLDQKSRILLSSNVMKRPFLEFAKAYCLYTPLSGARIELRALKCIERALCEAHKEPDILKLTSSSLDRAATLAREHFSDGTAYHIGQQLVSISRLLNEKALIPRSLHWRNPIPRQNDRTRTGPKALEERKHKQPNLEALKALGRIFASNPKEPRDIFTTCTAALLLSAPLRITAVLALREDCEIEERKRDGSRAYGRRSQPAKGSSPRVTWVHEGMVDIAREAVRKLRAMTAEGRALASWLENHPKEFYRHKNCPSVPEDEPLTIEQTASALGIGSAKRFAIAQHLRRFSLPCKDGQNSLRSLNRWVHKRLPSQFPWYDKVRKIKFSEALFCMRAHEIRRDMPALPYMAWKPRNNDFNNDLQSRRSREGYVVPSIFDRHQGQLSGLDSFRVNSHQFRHFLSTLCEIGGLPEALHAEWAAREDVKQNRSYNDMTEFHFLDLFRQHDDSLQLDRPLEEIRTIISESLPMTRQEFNTLVHPTAHVTVVGYCTHDWVMQTCQRHRDCMLCAEQVVIKGDRRIEDIRECLRQTIALRAEADKAIAAGMSEAGRWYEHQLLVEKAMTEMLQILEDPTIENGTVIRLRRDSEFSPLRFALESRGFVERRDFVPLARLQGASSGVANVEAS